MQWLSRISENPHPPRVHATINFLAAVYTSIKLSNTDRPFNGMLLETKQIKNPCCRLFSYFVLYTSIKLFNMDRPFNGMLLKTKQIKNPCCRLFSYFSFFYNKVFLVLLYCQTSDKRIYPHSSEKSPLF